DGFRGRLVSGIPRRCVSQGAGGAGRGGPDLRVPEPVGVAARRGPGVGSPGQGLRGARVQLGGGGAAVRGLSGGGGGRPGVSRGSRSAAGGGAATRVRTRL